MDPSAPPYSSGYPPQHGFVQPDYNQPPGLGYPSGQPGYPPSQPGYPPGQPQYPPTQQPGYPTGPSTGGLGFQLPPQQYPHSGPSSQQTPYPSYPPPAGGPGYPPQQTGGYPPQGAYPPQNSGGYPPQHGGYPPQGYPPPQQGYSAGPYQQQPAQPGCPPPHSAYPSQGYQQYGAPHGNAPGHFPPPTAAPVNPYYSSGVPVPGQRPSAPQTGPSRGYGGKLAVRGTVVPAANFDKEADAQVLRKAMKGLGTDEKQIIAILAKRSNRQRQEIKVSYKQSFGRDLIKDLKSELSGNFERVILGIMQTPAEYDAECIRNAVKGLGTNDDTLVEILCSRTNEEITDAKLSYKQMFNRDLERDIQNDTSGDYARLLMQMANAARDRDSTPVDPVKAQNDAKAIYEAGEKKLGTDEETFRRIFSVRSWPQLEAMFNEYTKLYHKDITQAIKGELSYNFKHCMLAIAACVRNRPDYFADRLHKSMKGLGTDERALTRLVVSRCEKDMVQVKECFRRRFGKSLDQWIAEDVSGDYKRVLLALIAEH